MLLPDGQTENKITYKVEESENNADIKQVLKKKLFLSSRLLTKLKKEQSVLLNNKCAKYHEKVKTGDHIIINMQEEPNQFKPEDMPFHVIYEDIDIIVINKPSGIVSHPTKSHQSSTVANAAANYLLKNKIRCKIRFVNRLDMDTSGLLVIAKNSYSHHILSEQMKANQVEKKYIAFVEGIVTKNSDTIDAPIYRPADDSIKRTVDERGQDSITKYRVIERYKDSTMLEIELLTGRTHQIRVHMQYIGHPVISDHLYGKINPRLIERQALHAYSLKFRQPRYREIIELNAPLTEDLVKLKDRLKQENKIHV